MPATAQVLRIVTYNAATDTNPIGDTARAGMASVLQGIGIDSLDGIQRPLDILSLQETTTSMQGADSIVSILNGLYGAGTYARTTVIGQTTDGTTQAVIYNTHTLQLLSQTSIGTANDHGAARAPIRVEFQPIGHDSSTAFYLYSDHYKSGTTTTDVDRRATEAAIVHANAASLGAGAHIIFSGDFNTQSSSEPGYSTLTAAGAGQAIDPLNSPGNWHANSAFAGLDSQATQVTGVNGLTGGGLDDRFDFQLLSAPMLSGPGTTLIPTSYHVFGNNGSAYNGDINSLSNTALPASEYAPLAGQPTRTDVLAALATASDHLPLVADYMVPEPSTLLLALLASGALAGFRLSALRRGIGR
jgi:endonuclease/exonuclease/phosphatase family metal-dependent hydrolase